VQPQYSRSIEGVERACEKRNFYEWEVKKQSQKRKTDSSHKFCASSKSESEMDCASSQVRVRGTATVVALCLRGCTQVTGSYERISVSFPPDMSAHLTERALSLVDKDA